MNTGQISPSRNSRTRSAKTRSFSGLRSSRSSVSSASSKSATLSSMAKRASASRDFSPSGIGTISLSAPSRYTCARSSARSMKPVMVDPERSGIWRRTSGSAEAGCRIFSKSRTEPDVLSTLSRNNRCGTLRVSRSRRITCSAGIFLLSASATTTAASTAERTGRLSY